MDTMTLGKFYLSGCFPCKTILTGEPGPRTGEKLGMKAGCRGVGVSGVGLKGGLPVLLHSLVVRQLHPTHTALLPDGPAL